MRKLLKVGAAPFYIPYKIAEKCSIPAEYEYWHHDSGNPTCDDWYDTIGDPFSDDGNDKEND